MGADYARVWHKNCATSTLEAGSAPSGPVRGPGRRLRSRLNGRAINRNGAPQKAGRKSARRAETALALRRVTVVALRRRGSR
ncbi:hypothetical protein MTO96_001111 [Rhipicephalus appendiculatus]